MLPSVIARGMLLCGHERVAITGLAAGSGNFRLRRSVPIAYLILTHGEKTSISKWLNHIR
jgi:hypothetical protein